MTTNPLPNNLAPANSNSQFWQRTRDRKWLYLIGGVLIGTLLIIALQRSWQPAYVVPASRYPDRVSEPLLNGRTLNFPATAIGNFPVYPVGEGGQVMPYVNRGAADLVVKEAYFQAKNAGRPLIPGVATAAYVFRFEPKHRQTDGRGWGRLIDDLILPAGAETRVVVHLVDPTRAGQRQYGTLVLRCKNGDLIQFESTQVIVQPE